MSTLKSMKKILLLVSFIILSVFAFNASISAKASGITEADTYVLKRDANGNSLFQYQSPCMIGYDVNNKYGGDGVAIQAFVFTLYNKPNERVIPAYCSDIHVTAEVGANYRRLNLEDSSFSGNAAGVVRAILQNGFYIIPKSGETDAAHAERVAAKTEALRQAAGVETLTTGEAIAATQAAIWRVVHGPSISFPKFCRYVFSPQNTKYGSLCSYSELKSMDNALINANIKEVYNYLISLKPVSASQKTVSSSSFTDMSAPTFAQNGDGTYNVSVTTTVNVSMSSGDSLTLKAELGGYDAETALSNGSQTVTLTMNSVPASMVSENVILSISGYQSAADYFFYEPEGGRGESQCLVGYDNSRLPVYARVAAGEERVIQIYKVGKLPDRTSYSYPLKGIVFDFFLVATLDEYLSGSVDLPDASDYQYPALSEYSVITDANGYGKLSFSQQGLPDGIYLVVEREHPSIVAPVAPFYLQVPMVDPEKSGYVYDITFKPKNEVKGGVKIGKDVITLNNDEATVDAAVPHTWIISATIPEDISKGQSYVISDTLDNRLDYVGNVKVVLDNTDDNSSVELTENTDYRLYVTDNDSLSEGKPSDSFRVELTSAGMNRIATSIGKAEYDNFKLRVYFDARVNGNAQMGVSIPNDASVTYINESGIQFDAASDEPFVYTGGANLLKVDANNNSKPLPGAVFEVYRSATQEEIDAGDSRLTELLGVQGKVVKVSFFSNPSQESGPVTSATSGEDGKIGIYGLAYGKYYLVETKAPDGYNSLDQVMELTINEYSHAEENTIIVENKAGVVLPQTGGFGTAVFTATGISLMLLACMLMIAAKRRA